MKIVKIVLIIQKHLKNLRKKMNEQELREQIAKEIESIDIESSKTNAVGMKILSAKIARGKNV